MFEVGLGGSYSIGETRECTRRNAVAVGPLDVAGLFAPLTLHL